MPESAADLRDRVSRLAEVTDSLLVTAPANVRYVTGFTGSNGWALWHRGRLLLLTDARYRLQAAEECVHSEVRVCTESLAEGLKAEVVGGTVRFDAAQVSVATLGELRRHCPTTEFVERSGVVERLRACKSDDEITRIRAALAVAEAAGLEVVAGGMAGASETDLGVRLDHTCRLHGASAMAFETIVASGPRGALPHARPTSALIGTGVAVQLDWGCRLDGYCSDISRVAVAGPIPGRWSGIADAVAEALEQSVAAIQPGRPVAEVDRVARAVLARHGLAEYFSHSLGHGVGLEVHEAPRLSARSEETLRVGMVLTIEPGVYVAGEGGVRLENMVVVGVDGAEVLNTLPLEWLSAPYPS